MALAHVGTGYGFGFTFGERAPLLLGLLAFLITFACTRLYTRLARARGWGSGNVGGVHLHHMVVGILMVLVTGLLAVAFWPDGLVWRSVLGVLFGAGAALTLDEFALWLYLRDVYWCEEGRSSIDATVTGVILATLLLVGSSPFGLEGGQMPSAIVFGVVAFNILAALVTFLKGKLVLGLVSVFVPVVGIAGAVRLAKPRSLWAKHVYRAHAPEKLARARARFEASGSRYRRLHERFDDLIGGAPSFTHMAPLRMQVVDGRLRLHTVAPTPEHEPSGT
jgi:hypothetical protein